MRPSSLISGSWVALVLAVIAWGGAGYFIWSVLGLQQAHDQYVGNAQAATIEQTQSAQVRSIARETINERAALERVASIELLAAVNMIESIGDTAGVKVQVRDAQTEKTIVGKAGTPPINVVNLSVQTQGSYATVMRVFEMMETLPIPVVVQRASFIRSQAADSGKAVLWNLDVGLKLFTTATISS